jgi:flagellar motor switch protein FliN/FliY
MTASNGRDAEDTGVAVEEEQAAEAASAEGSSAGETSTAGASTGEEGKEVKKADFQPVNDAPVEGTQASMGLLMDVVLPVTVELGRTTRTIREILELSEGSVIRLDRAAGEPVDIMVGGKLLGKGEVVVLNEKFGVRLIELAGSVEGIVKR